MLQLNFSPFPVIETERLLLRQFQMSDAEEYHLLRSDATVMQYIGRPRSKSVEDSAERIRTSLEGERNGTMIAWALIYKPTGTFIGAFGYWRTDPENHRGEIGYMLHTDWQRKGLATEALMATTEFGFRELHFHTIFAVIDPRNVASKNLLLRCGYEQEGIFKHNFYWEGEFQDSGYFGKINPYGY